MNPQQYAGLIGLLFAAVWVSNNFGDAVLSLVVGAIFYLGTAIYRGEVDLDELQARSPTPSRSSRTVR